MATEFNLIIIGGGSAAFAAAIKAVKLGATVAIVEEGVIGGTCLNKGCIPTKNLLRAGEIYYYSKRNHFQGINFQQRPLNFKRVIEQKDKLVKELRKVKYLDILKEYPNIKFIKGRAEFLSNKEIKVGKDILSGEKFIIATGASASILPVEGLDRIEYLTSTEVLDLKKLPKSMIILGGRFVALEFAQMYSHFGTKVTVLQRSPTIIPDDEEEISIALQKFLTDEGIKIVTGVKLLSVKEQTPHPPLSPSGERSKVRVMKIVTCEIGVKRKTLRQKAFLLQQAGDRIHRDWD